MIIIKYDPYKNIILKKVRDISFDIVEEILQTNGPLDIIKNNSKNHTKQFMYVIPYKKYIYVVPFVENENEIFLKTIYPSRKYTKLYFGKGE